MDHAVSQIDPFAYGAFGFGNFMLPVLLHVTCHDQ